MLCNLKFSMHHSLISLIKITDPTCNKNLEHTSPSESVGVSEVRIQDEDATLHHDAHPHQVYKVSGGARIEHQSHGDCSEEGVHCDLDTRYHAWVGDVGRTASKLALFKYWEGTCPNKVQQTPGRFTAVNS